MSNNSLKLYSHHDLFSSLFLMSELGTPKKAMKASVPAVNFMGCCLECNATSQVCSIKHGLSLSLMCHICVIHSIQLETLLLSFILWVWTPDVVKHTTPEYSTWLCANALQCVAVRCRALQCVALHCRVLPCVAVRWRALPCIAVHCRV